MDSTQILAVLKITLQFVCVFMMVSHTFAYVDTHRRIRFYEGDEKRMDVYDKSIQATTRAIALAAAIFAITL